MNFTPKTKSTHQLLSITFNDKFLKISSWYSTFEYLTSTMEVTVKNIKFQQHFATIFRHLTRKIMASKYHSFFWSILLCFVRIQSLKFGFDCGYPSIYFINMKSKTTHIKACPIVSPRSWVMAFYTKRKQIHHKLLYFSITLASLMHHLQLLHSCNILRPLTNGLRWSPKVCEWSPPLVQKFQCLQTPLNSKCPTHNTHHPSFTP